MLLISTYTQRYTEPNKPMHADTSTLLNLFYRIDYWLDSVIYSISVRCSNADYIISVKTAHFAKTFASNYLFYEEKKIKGRRVNGIMAKNVCRKFSIFLMLPFVLLFFFHFHHSFSLAFCVSFYPEIGNSFRSLDRLNVKWEKVFPFKIINEFNRIAVYGTSNYVIRREKRCS